MVVDEVIKMFGRKSVPEGFLRPVEYRYTEPPIKRNFIHQCKTQYPNPFIDPREEEEEYPVDAYLGAGYKPDCYPITDRYPTIEEINNMDQDTLRVNLLRELTFAMIEQIRRSDILHNRVSDLEDRVNELEDVIDTMIKGN